MSGHISIDLPPDFPSPLSCTEYYAGESVRLVRYSQQCLISTSISGMEFAKIH